MHSATSRPASRSHASSRRRIRAAPRADVAHFHTALVILLCHDSRQAMRPTTSVFHVQVGNVRGKMRRQRQGSRQWAQRRADTRQFQAPATRPWQAGLLRYLARRHWTLHNSHASPLRARDRKSAARYTRSRPPVADGCQSGEQITEQTAGKEWHVRRHRPGDRWCPADN